ncbi:MAG TPA: NAD-dependent epimerase/dehydratase family protein [Longimicrobiales bacterium]|nr:NAD-dependent epimerase/dehydratase family protein [Longimicrobiales bacterium]
MPILVTGAAGFIGSHVTDRLLADGHAVVGLDNFDPFYPAEVKEGNLAGALAHPEFTLVRGDIRDAGALRDLPEGIDTVVHLAARGGVRPSLADPVGYADVNVVGTARLLAWCRDRGIRRLVFASSSSVYGNTDRVPFAESDPVGQPLSPYAATKRAGELLCHVSSRLDGLAVACLRFFTVYGPRQRPDLAIHKFARILRDGGRLPMYGDGNSARDYTYVDDAVAGVTAALRWANAHPGAYDVFNLGNSRTVTLREMVAILGEEMGVVPVADVLPRQAGDVERTWADVTRAREVLGWEAETGFREGVRGFAGWFEAQSPTDR